MSLQSVREVCVDGGSGVNRIEKCEIYSPSNMETDSQFVFSGRGASESNREAENLKDDYIPSEIRVQGGSKKMRKVQDALTITEKNDFTI